MREVSSSAQEIPTPPDEAITTGSITWIWFHGMYDVLVSALNGDLWN